MNDLDFGVLCRALKDQTSLLILSVNRCNLTDTAAHDVQRLVKNQCLRRDHEQWLTGLRDGEVNRVALRELQESWICMAMTVLRIVLERF